MSDDRRQPAEMDVLDLAEAVAAGRITRTQAEATLRDRHADDAGALAADLAELGALIAAIGGVRRHAVAFRQAADNRAAGESAPVGAELSIDPRPVGESGVRVRSKPAQRNRWAAPALLAAAAVVVVAVLVGSSLATAPVAGSPSPAASGIAVASPSVPPSPSAPATGPSGSPGASTMPSSTPSESPSAAAAPGMPEFPTAPLTGAPAIAYWTLPSLTSIAITTWAPDGSAPLFSFTTDRWADPDPSTASVIARQVVVSPDGSRIVFAETDGSPKSLARVRVFGADGSVLWSSSLPSGPPDLVWSADGSRLVVGSQPATWRIVDFATGTAKVTTRTFPGQAYRVLGFSRSGAILYGWDTQGEAEWWQTPFQVPVAGGAVVPITRFSGKAEPLAQSNGTTPGSHVVDLTVWSDTLQQPGVDPNTGRVLDRGGASGDGAWELRDGSTVATLRNSPSESLAWAPDGSILDYAPADSGITGAITSWSPAAPYGMESVLFEMPAGAYTQQFMGVKGSFALVELGPEHSSIPWPIESTELLVVDLTNGATAVLVPDSTGLAGIHIAGWITGG